MKRSNQKQKVSLSQVGKQEMNCNQRRIVFTSSKGLVKTTEPITDDTLSCDQRQVTRIFAVPFSMEIGKTAIELLAIFFKHKTHQYIQ